MSLDQACPLPCAHSHAAFPPLCTYTLYLPSLVHIHTLPSLDVHPYIIWFGFDIQILGNFYQALFLLLLGCEDPLQPLGTETPGLAFKASGEAFFFNVFFIHFSLGCPWVAPPFCALAHTALP